MASLRLQDDVQNPAATIIKTHIFSLNFKLKATNKNRNERIKTGSNVLCILLILAEQASESVCASAV